MERETIVREFLDRHKIRYDIYHHPASPTIEEAKAHWREDGSKHCKNLFFRNHKGDRHYLVCFDCDRSLAIHDLEHRLRQGKLTFASPQRMERYLGLEPGSVSPFGLINDAAVRFRTLGSEDTSKAYRIPLSILNLSQQHAQDQKTADGTVCSIEKMVDEQENNIYLDDGYPDTKNKDYTTYWYNYPYGRNSSPYDVYIDLFGSYIGDRLYVYSRSKPKLSVYGMKDFGYPWEKLGEINIAFNAWAFLDLKSIRFRFLKLSFDLNDFGAMSGIPEGGEAFPNSNEYNPTLDRIDNIVLYGRPAGNIPDSNT